MLDVVARERVFASVTAEQNLIDLYVPPNQLIAAVGDQRPKPG